MNFDYRLVSKRNTPKDKRERMNIGDIWDNSVKCLICGETIRSTNRYDMAKCKCGNVAVDGGSHYHKVSFKENKFESKIVYYKDVE